MFGKKKIEAAQKEALRKTEAMLLAFREEYKRKTLNYFDIQVNNMNGSGALAWLRGALELAQEVGILTANEAAQIDSKGLEKYEAKQKAAKEERERLLAERKAKAKAAKEGM